MPVPNGLSMVEAAAMPEVYGAAYLFLFYEGFLKAGDTLLVQAGGSGLASVLIPMAKAFGTRVITTVLSDEVAKSIEHLHADLIIVLDDGQVAGMGTHDALLASCPVYQEIYASQFGPEEVTQHG